ncbi:BlaI/MecI/CopY family transcriptional regulator [Salmonella enterica]|nr:BlaI/MecI/CopY family transcriptional regulator [Salmonella enterica]EDT3043552.1 BlaI/MecI/CopY family transcriptional regulator [Salmonella enterica subsp. enterica serovar 6,7:k:-]EBC4404125.1 BlaI/MecI/CopY family transcriptional regulator [Salmonella enterica]EBK8416462.1 hypothetical protein [Salmonella enterica]ECF6151135.1 BlaI/MecI/CopY family transcriptional regulator [Salmonella enterica]
MSILKTVQMFIAMNPGVTTRDIIEGLTQFSQDRLQLAVCRLYGSGLATRKRDGRQFRYYAVPPADCHFEVFEPTPEVSALMETAKGLESKGLFHRAATIYMEAFSASSIESDRAAILAERQRCIGLAKPAVIAEDGCYLAGRFAGGR